jgi:CxxC motif-containing protein (DUF1111 family)
MCLSAGALVFASAGAFAERDPGVRSGDAGAGGPLPNLKSYEEAYFDIGLDDFNEVEGVDDGLGPRFNLDSCGGCHAQPAAGGTAPSVNPQVAVATKGGARNVVPSFITLNGPVREARFKFRSNGSRDGGVHALFVTTGRSDDTGDAGACAARQDDFAGQLQRNNVIFRIPTPTFGLGLIEHIPDGVIQANLNANAGIKSAFGISGRANHNGNDGTIARFGWKAQNVSLMLFSGEAYNVEMGISNELFMVEREEHPDCQAAVLPNDTSALDQATPGDSFGGVEKFAFFMRFAAAPTPSTTNPGGASSIANGRRVFNDIGCALCHTPQLVTGNAASEALRNQPVNLFSDLGLHQMGPRLADNVNQGEAQGDEFRTAPLWGLGKRIFFLHDGRTRDLVRAIQEHASGGNSQFGPSEANRVISNYNNLRDSSQQDLLNFLRSL